VTSSPDETSAASAAPRALVTGAAGFIGAHLVRRLASGGRAVVALARPSSDLWRLDGCPAGVTVVRGDLRDLGRGTLDAALSDVDVIYHLAAAGVDQAQQDADALVETNVAGTLAVLRLAERVGARRVVYCGSCFEYGAVASATEGMLPAPAAEYGATKAAGWMLAHAFARRTGLAVVSLRPFTVYGPMEGAHRLIPYTILRALDGDVLELTGGEQTRDFVFVDDAVDAFVAAGASPDAAGGTFNVCSGAETSVRHVVETIVELTGGRAVARFGARPYRAVEMWRLSGSPERARAVLGWRAATPLRAGLERTVEWFRAHRAAHAVYRS
jgi:nucleoside-diphosphate-sugar epimerase